MRVFMVMVVRNEADRFLDCCLQWHSTIFDGIHVYDDGSTDDTAEVAELRGAVVRRRPDTVPSFMEHEGKCRQAAWDAFVIDMKPELGDWVCAIDADELLVAQDDEQNALWLAIAKAVREDMKSVVLTIPEIWDVQEEDGYLSDPYLRVDGYWPKTTGRRLFAYEPGGVFADKAMACGSAPTYANGDAHVPPDLFLLHYGYALPDDRMAKYVRYSLTSTGHNNAHINSIVEEASLSRWTGPHFKVWRGVDLGLRSKISP